MKWIIMDSKKIECMNDVVVQSTDDQYLAGSFVRNPKGTIVFRSSDGAWTIEVELVKRYLVLHS